MLTTILDNIYGSWIDEVSSTKGVVALKSYGLDLPICNCKTFLRLFCFKQGRKEKILRTS